MMPPRQPALPPVTWATDRAGASPRSRSRAISASGVFNVVRVMLQTEDDQTVIERRGNDLAIASQAATRKFPRLI